MSVAQDRNLQDAAQYAKSLFRENPQLAIDAAARQVAENCRRGLVKSTLAGLRREIRSELVEQEGSVMQAARKLSNAAKVPMPASAESRATKLDRVRFLEAWALDNPMATNDQAREAVREQFGISLGSEIISHTMKLAREAWESQRKLAVKTHTPLEAPSALPLPEATSPNPVPVRHQAQEWAKAMKEAGIRLIEILPDGSVRLELAAL